MGPAKEGFGKSSKTRPGKERCFGLSIGLISQLRGYKKVRWSIYAEFIYAVSARFCFLFV